MRHTNKRVLTPAVSECSTIAFGKEARSPLVPTHLLPTYYTSREGRSYHPKLRLRTAAFTALRNRCSGELENRRGVRHQRSTQFPAQTAGISARDSATDLRGYPRSCIWAPAVGFFISRSVMMNGGNWLANSQPHYLTMPWEKGLLHAVSAQGWRRYARWVGILGCTRKAYLAVYSGLCLVIKCLQVLGRFGLGLVAG
jgi:hypothetical protein